MAFNENMEALNNMLKLVDPSKLEGINAICQLELTGDGGGVAQIKTHEGTIEVREGTPGSPDITIRMAGTDFPSLLSGQLNAVAAFMTGPIKIDGDMSLVFKLQKLLGG